MPIRDHIFAYTYCTMPRPPVSLTLKNPKRFGWVVRELMLSLPPGTLRSAAEVAGLSPRGLTLIIEGRRTRIRLATFTGIQKLCAAVHHSGNKRSNRSDDSIPIWRPAAELQKTRASRMTPNVPKRKDRALADAFLRVTANDAEFVLSNGCIEPSMRRRQKDPVTPSEVEAFVHALERATLGFRGVVIDNTSVD